LSREKPVLAQAVDATGTTENCILAFCCLHGKKTFDFSDQR
jgi:hypothetical protein